MGTAIGIGSGLLLLNEAAKALSQQKGGDASGPRRSKGGAKGESSDGCGPQQAGQQAPNAADLRNYVQEQAERQQIELANRMESDRNVEAAVNAFIVDLKKRHQQLLGGRANVGVASGLNINEVPAGQIKAAAEEAYKQAHLYDFERFAVAFIDHAIKACEIAVKERSRVARYKFNLARSYYAMATITNASDVGGLLEKASRHYGEAVDLGYAAAYNSLGQLYQNGEVHVLQGGGPIRVSADREMAVKLFTRGAELNDMLANYNLGMAYKNGESGVRPDRSKAFPYFSKAAEAGFVPAIIETALALRRGSGVTRNGTRAVELLKIAASRGSSEAMFWLGDTYQQDYIDPGLEYIRDIVVIDFNEAILWYGRAADAGDTRSQARLAEMLSQGAGLPAAQPEAAGRYWRLAAEGGSLEAQMQLANLIRDGRVPFRPKVGGAPDAGAHEIHSLYLSAFARGKTRAGLDLARLYRHGFPKNRGSEAIPKDHQKAVNLLWDVMDKTRSAPSDSDDANPELEVWAAFELIGMYDAGENKRRDGTSAIQEDQIAQLRADYGDPGQYRYIRTSAVTPGGIVCPRGPDEFWVLVWNWKRSEPPTEQMFDWFERRHQCKDIQPGDTRTKPENLGVLKRTRDAFKREFEAAQKDKSGTKTFVDRMVELVRGDTTKKQR